MSSWNCSIVPLYFPVSPVPPFPSLLPAFLRVFPKKSFLYPPCSCTYSLRDLNPTYISLFSYSTYQGAPVPKSLVNANQELKFSPGLYLPPFVSTCTLYSFVLSLYSHISPYRSTYPLYSIAWSWYSHISPYPSTYTPYSLVWSWYSHISPYPSSYILYSLVSFLLSYQYPCGFLNFLSTSFYLSSHNIFNEFAGQRSRNFLGKTTEQAILSSW